MNLTISRINPRVKYRLEDTVINTSLHDNFSNYLFSEELIIGWNFAFQNGLGLTIKTA